MSTPSFVFELAKFAPTFVPTILEGLFTGVFAVAFGLTTYALGHAKPSVSHRPGKGLFIGVSHLVFLLTIAHFALSLARCFSVKARSYRMEDFAWYFADEWEGVPSTTPIDTVRMVFYVTLVLINDGLTFYRLHSTWRHWPVLIVPGLSVLADIICGYMGLWTTFMFIIFNWIAWFTFTLSSALIVGHLLKNAPKPTRLRLNYEIINLVFYSAFLLVGATTMVAAGQDVFAGYFILAPPVVGTVILLATLQVGLPTGASSSRDALVFPGSETKREVQQSSDKVV
ncbi:hypothetical protein C8Q74DRAFT_1368026 [Fomes fomentarius]|nr:hypothetical protein C8Q74DRAFT_1368026 [Fomes fomentarius]